MEVQSSVENVDEVTKRAKVSVPDEMIAKEIEDRLDKLSRTASLKGFRPGKAPRHLVEKMHGSRVRLDVINHFISTSLRDVLQKENLNVVGMPDIDITSGKPGEDLTYTADISIFPEPTVTGYDHFDVKVPKSEVPAGDVDDVIERIRKSKASTRKAEFRTKAEGEDVVDVTVQVKVGDEEPGRPENAIVGLDEGQLPPELEAGIRGMEVGETKDVQVTFPEDHQQEKLRGAVVNYKVTLNGISEKVLPELTDDFAASLDIPEVKTVIELRLSISKRLEQEYEKQQQDAIRQAMLEQLLERNPFKIPQVLVDDEIRRMLVRAGVVDPNKTDFEEIDVERYRENLGEAAASRVRTSILVDRIAETENIKADDQDAAKYAEEVAQSVGIPAEEAKKYLLGKERRMGTLLELTRNKVLDFLQQRVAVTYEDRVQAEQGRK